MASVAPETLRMMRAMRTVVRKPIISEVIEGSYVFPRDDEHLIRVRLLWTENGERILVSKHYTCRYCAFRDFTKDAGFRCILF
jgi:hypothetical protein